ncbi:CPCC family cysteine-rich protein [Actinopolymorpha cephalotaxi]
MSGQQRAWSILPHGSALHMPCCGYRTLREARGSYDPCSVCY